MTLPLHYDTLDEQREADPPTADDRMTDAFGVPIYRKSPVPDGCEICAGCPDCLTYKEPTPLKTRTTIDWSNPDAPSTFSEVELVKAPGKPGVVTSHTFVILPKPGSRKGGGIWLPALIYYCREAAIRFPVFREELLDMVSKLPPAPPPDPVAVAADPHFALHNALASDT